MKIKLFTLFILFFSQNLNLTAQEILLNNYRFSSTLLNPALTGNSESISISTYFQGSSSILSNSPFLYQTYGLNLDAPILKFKKYIVSTGYRYYTNISGEAKFKSNGHLISVSIARKIELDDIIHHFSIGIEGGVNIRKVNEKGLRWPTQIGPNGFDPKIPFGEMVSDVVNKDFNVGAQYSMIVNNESRLTLGYGVFHINEPNVGLLSNGFKENRRTNIYLLGNYRMNPKLELLPTIIYMKYGQFDAYNVSLGTKYYIKPSAWICLDLGYIKYNQPFIGLSCGIKKLSFFGNYGFENNASLTRMETGLMYRFGNKSNHKSVNIL